MSPPPEARKQRRRRQAAARLVQQVAALQLSSASCGALGRRVGVPVLPGTRGISPSHPPAPNKTRRNHRWFRTVLNAAPVLKPSLFYHLANKANSHQTLSQGKSNVSKGSKLTAAQRGSVGTARCFQPGFQGNPVPRACKGAATWARNTYMGAKLFCKSDL